MFTNGLKSAMWDVWKWGYVLEPSAALNVPSISLTYQVCLLVSMKLCVTMLPIKHLKSSHNFYFYTEVQLDKSELFTSMGNMKAVGFTGFCLGTKSKASLIQFGSFSG